MPLNVFLTNPSPALVDFVFECDSVEKRPNFQDPRGSLALGYSAWSIQSAMHTDMIHLDEQGDWPREGGPGLRFDHNVSASTLGHTPRAPVGNNSKSGR